MKLDKTSETFLIFIVSLVLIITAYYVNMVASVNNASSKFDTELGLGGARLSDTVYATATKASQWDTRTGQATKYDFVIMNHGPVALKNWMVFMKIPDTTDVIGTEGVGVKREAGRLFIEPDSKDLVMDPGESVEFSLTMNSSDSYVPTTIRFSGYEVFDIRFSIAGNIIILVAIGWAILFIGFLVTRFNLKNYRARQKNDVRIILQSMNTFINFIDAKDPYTRGHSKRVAMYAAEIAKRMRLSDDEVQNIYYAGLLHDAGKISVPDAVLNKPGTLTDEERRQIQDHTVAGGKMLKQLSSLRGIRETALYHHERYDGKGYPEGLKGEAIPLYARIVGVADSYDAMSSNRVYRRHLNKDEIIEEIQQGAATQFDPNIVPYMVDMINDGYVNVVKVETAERDEGSSDFNITEDQIPGVYMGF
jgi:hypothetical protein